MIRLRDAFSILVGVLVLGVPTCADMMSVPPMEVGYRQSARVCSKVEGQRTDSIFPFDCPNVMDLNLEPFQLSPGAGTDPGRHSKTQPPQILTDGQNSLSLCLSAIIGLGLCSSAHYVKRLSLGFIPEWYHNGGPFQIGHSFVVERDSVSPIPVRCFVQPVRTVEDVVSQHCCGTFVCLGRKSQSTPNVITPRGPPLSKIVGFSPVCSRAIV